MKPTIIKQMTIKYKGHNLFISAVLHHEGEWENFYEIGVYDLDKEFEEKESIHVPTLPDCYFYFNKFVLKYREKKVDNFSKGKKKESKNDIKEGTPIPKRYLKFAEDYKKVYDSCYAAHTLGELHDGGAINFDTCTVFIGKRVKKGFLNAALKPYGLKAHVDNDIIFTVVPLTQYQAFANTMQAEYMSNMFKSLGYESSVYYRID